MNDAEHLKSVRKELGLTQVEMADKMGYGSQQYISLIENHERKMSGVARKCLHYLAQIEGISYE